MTAIEASDQVPYKAEMTRIQFVRAVKIVLRRAGETFVSAAMGQDGNCTACGESGRCPGVHTHQEYQYSPKVAA